MIFVCARTMFGPVFFQSTGNFFDTNIMLTIGSPSSNVDFNPVIVSM